MLAIKDARYRVISDNCNSFSPGDIVIALENSVVPYCVREEKYIPGCTIEDLSFDDYNPLCTEELEMLDDQPYLVNGRKEIRNDRE